MHGKTCPVRATYLPAVLPAWYCYKTRPVRAEKDFAGDAAETDGVAAIAPRGVRHMPHMPQATTKLSPDFFLV